MSAMNGIFNLKDLKRLFANEKAVKIILAVGAAIILFFFLAELSSILGGEKASVEGGGISELESRLEKRLCDILSQVDGVGRVSVMVTLEGSEETLVGERSTITGVASPLVRGVIIVCDGGGSVIIRQKLIETVSGALGISSARVSVEERVGGSA